MKALHHRIWPDACPRCAAPMQFRFSASGTPRRECGAGHVVTEVDLEQRKGAGPKPREFVNFDL